MQFEFPKNQNSIIKVIGVGGGGGNAVNNMFEQGIDGVNFIVCNTDIQALRRSTVPVKVRLGVNQTEGLGAGANPETGKKSAMETLEEVREVLKEGTKMVFITAGMGGGTGTGAAPVIASLAKEMNILTVGIVTTPFMFEGPRRLEQARQGIAELEKVVDTLIIIDNNNLNKILGSKLPMKKAFEEADQVLCNAARGIAEIITSEGYINVDFADVCTIMRDGGKALMGTAEARGENRAMEAVEAAVNSPLLDNIGLQGARGIVVNITASEDSLTMDESNAIMDYVHQGAGEEANVIFGIVYDEDMGDKLRVTVIATRYDEQAASRKVTPARPKAAPEAAHGQQRDLSFEGREILMPPKKETPARLNAAEREERLRVLGNKTYDIHDSESLQGLESIPAYQRKRVTLDMDGGKSHSSLSRTFVDDDQDSGYRMRENSFLNDRPD
jgi:cell division protein FtsZ